MSHKVIWHTDGTDEIFNLHLTDAHSTKRGVVREIRKALGPMSENDHLDPVKWVYVYDVSKSRKAAIEIILRAHNEKCVEKIKDERFILLDEWRKI